jgi:DNA-binding transcriptional LysR family regulator
MNLNHLEVFAAVAEARSFTRAAERLGADKGHLSRVVRALEQELGVVLLARTTRTVTLTPAGEQLWSRVAAPLAALGSATEALADRTPRPEGLVTLATTPELGRAVVAPLLVAFRALHPAVRVRLLLDVVVVELVAARADLALRVGPSRGRTAKVRRLGELEAGFFAAPHYLARRGAPRTRADLAAHDGLWPAAPRARASFAPRGAPPPPAVDTDDFGALLELARAGGGVAVLPLFLAARDVALGQLVRVVSDVSLPGAPLYLVTRPERPLPPRVAVLSAFLAEHVPSALGSRPRAG